MNKQVLKINNRELLLSNLNKDLYPSYGFTKFRILEYYSHIASDILPFLQGRALTLKCYPNGVMQDYFYMKRCPAHRPAWVETAEVPYGDAKKITYCMANNLETLMWVENLASIELHVPLAKANAPNNPDSVVFDLDPGENVGIVDCAHVALIIKELLSDLKLESWVKTSGRKGIHVFVPLDSQKTSFESTKTFSRAVAEIMQKNYPDLITAKIDKKLRTNKVFINWSQNDASKTMVCAFSLRAMEKPTVSFPYSWDEFEKITMQKDAGKFHVLATQAITAAHATVELLAEIQSKKQRLPNS